MINFLTIKMLDSILLFYERGRLKEMRYIYGSLIIIFSVTQVFGKQISKDACEEVWANGEILHEFDEIEISGGNYRPRSYIKYEGKMFYGTLTIDSLKGDVETIWVSMTCWDSQPIK